MLANEGQNPSDRDSYRTGGDETKDVVTRNHYRNTVGRDGLNQQVGMKKREFRGHFCGTNGRHGDGVLGSSVTLRQVPAWISDVAALTTFP